MKTGLLRSELKPGMAFASGDRYIVYLVISAPDPLTVLIANQVSQSLKQIRIEDWSLCVDDDVYVFQDKHFWRLVEEK